MNHYNLSEIYLSGGMSVSSKPDMNFSGFNRIAKVLRDDGVPVVNPTELDDLYKTPEKYKHCWEYFLGRDLKYIIKRKIRHVILIDDWEKSLGSKMEIFIILYLFKGQIWLYSDYNNDRKYKLTPVNIRFNIDVIKEFDEINNLNDIDIFIDK